jgi:para-nitrobenzyl esterase
MSIERSADIVRIDSGLVRGAQGNGSEVRVFKGIPFAAPPVGELRWRPPQPPAAWSGVRHCDVFGPICPQFAGQPGSFYQLEFYLLKQPKSEDCLYLNVWTAARSPSEKRPVMVWFYGGAFTEGSGSLPSFQGEALAEKGVVLVTINYRLGAFGFLAHPELTAESPHHASGNYGLLDQAEALRWVQRNIAAFGGDPGNVTIFGQSAGAMGVFAQLTSPLSGGLFHRAIGHSGSGVLFIGPEGTLAQAEEEGVQYAASRGAGSLRELRALSWEALLGADRAAYESQHFGPVVDGWYLPEPPGRLMAEGKFHDTSLMVGATANEATTFVPNNGGPSATDFRRLVAGRYGERAAEFLTLYPIDSEEQRIEAQIASISDHIVAEMRVWANTHNKCSTKRAYLYHFDRCPPGRNSGYYRAWHSSELYYVFGTLDSTDRPWEPADRHLSDVMTSCWASFAARGDPNFAGLPEWPTYDAKKDVVMEFGDRIGPMLAPRKAHLAFQEREIERALASQHT